MLEGFEEIREKRKEESAKMGLASASPTSSASTS